MSDGNCEHCNTRADRDRYSDLLDISQGVVRELRAMNAAQYKEHCDRLIELQRINNAEIERLRAALAEAQRDAERYRFLQRRVCVVGTEALCGVRMKAAKFDFVNLPKLSEVPGNAACALDAAIDAAILATKEGKKDE